MEQSFHHHRVGCIAGSHARNIIFKKEHEENQAADVQAALDWKADILPEILQSFKKEDIFNTDGTGLYYRGYFDRGHCLRGDELSGEKKQRTEYQCCCVLMCDWDREM